jgi:hypothetical protein
MSESNDDPTKEPLLQSERFRLTALGVVANVVVVIAPKYFGVELSAEEVGILVLGISGLIANYIQARTRRNTSV